jgi:hypothetical protein
LGNGAINTHVDRQVHLALGKSATLSIPNPKLTPVIQAPALDRPAKEQGAGMLLASRYCNHRFSGKMNSWQGITQLHGVVPTMLKIP